MCIGPEKTGTSWLYSNLKFHPQVYLTPVKEIRYFWEKANLPKQDIIKRLSTSHWHNKIHQKYLKSKADFYKSNQAKLSLDNPELISELIWDMKYLLFSRDDEWYFSLFEESKEKLSGDITPLYSKLAEPEVKRISSILPDLKIIILLRNPMNRAWSKAKMNLCQHQKQKLNSVSKERFYRDFDREYSHLSSYISLINKWKRNFPEHNIYVGYYDKLLREPSVFFDEICSFLDIDSSLFPVDKRRQLSARVNRGFKIKIPEEYSVYLSNLYTQCIEDMAAIETREPYPQQWLESIKKVSVVSH